MSYPVIHIVKRFGRVGGMESYVWHLVHGLVHNGIEIVVVCEQVLEPPEDGVLILQVDAAPERPRWKSMMTFQTRVEQKIRDRFQGQLVLVHSHERSICHQVTTFHGPPIEPSSGFRWFSRFNRRLTAWQKMERAELVSPHVQMILPVSSQIRTHLMCRYPEIGSCKVELAWPGVIPPIVAAPEKPREQAIGVKFAFVGREWKRKGLDIAVLVVKEIRKTYPGSTLEVFGVKRERLPRWMTQYQWMITKGWISEIPWSDIDLLLHPARSEPFGMVVPEARSYGIPVVMSSQVGAIDLEFSETEAVDVNAPLANWCASVRTLVGEARRIPEVKWTWEQLVNQHIEIIYPRLKPVIP